MNRVEVKEWTCSFFFFDHAKKLPSQFTVVADMPPSRSYQYADRFFHSICMKPIKKIHISTYLLSGAAFDILLSLSLSLCLSCRSLSLSRSSSDLSKETQMQTMNSPSLQWWIQIIAFNVNLPRTVDLKRKSRRNNTCTLKTFASNTGCN